MRKAKAKADAGDATAGLVNQLNLEEFAGVLDNAPPGTDELVALSKVRTTRLHECVGLWQRGHAAARVKLCLSRSALPQGARFPV